MFTSAKFDITPTNDICAKISFDSHLLMSFGLPTFTIEVFKFLADPNGDVLERFDDATACHVYTFFLPISLCYFIVERYEKDVNVDLDGVRRWIKENEEIANEPKTVD